MYSLKKFFLHPKYGIYFLISAGFILLLSSLGSRGLWTQEHRWLEIVDTMQNTGDYFHPLLGGMPYYDKPLLSYWLIALAAKIAGSLNLWSLRLPSGLSAVLALLAFFHLAKKLLNHEFAILASWLMLTTFYFIFWGRTASADMLNLSGMLCALAWYMSYREKTSFFSYGGFFIIVALTALCKGLSGPVLILLAVFIDIIKQNKLAAHVLNWKFWAALGLGVIIFLLPFALSQIFYAPGYEQSGLELVYKENILRYFKPFDHKGSILTYFIFLPIYVLPWTPWFFCSIYHAIRYRMHLPNSMLWVWKVLMAGFVFFTLSGSRRNYYILPLVPFAILTTTYYLQSLSLRSQKIIWIVIGIFWFMFFFGFDVLQPLYYTTVIE